LTEGEPDSSNTVVNQTNSSVSSFASNRNSSTTILNVGDGSSSYNRYLQIDTYQDCKTRCTMYITTPYTSSPICVKEEYSCITRTDNVKLYMNQVDQSLDTIFSHYFNTYPARVCTQWLNITGPYGQICAKYEVVQLRDDDYMGCGVRVSQNVLRYFGIKLTQKQLNDGYIPTHHFGAFSDHIATFPTELSKGLQKALDKLGKTKFKVKLHTKKHWPDVVEHLKNGFPVIALVENGGHWVAVSGFRRVEGKVGFHIVDNNSSYWQPTLDLSLDGSSSFLASLGIISKYKHGTFLSFEKV
jgi:hypothetical protein